jgi:hypothetical protein
LDVADIYNRYAIEKKGKGNRMMYLDHISISTNDLELMQRPELATRDRSLLSDGLTHLAYRVESRGKVLDPVFNEVEIVG